MWQQTACCSTAQNIDLKYAWQWVCAQKMHMHEYSIITSRPSLLGIVFSKAFQIVIVSGYWLHLNVVPFRCINGYSFIDFDIVSKHQTLNIETLTLFWPISLNWSAGCESFQCFWRQHYSTNLSMQSPSLMMPFNCTQPHPDNQLTP